MFDNLEKPIYDFQTRLNCECVEAEIDSSVITLQYTGRDSYQNLDAYLSERRSVLQKLNPMILPIRKFTSVLGFLIALLSMLACILIHALLM